MNSKDLKKVIDDHLFLPIDNNLADKLHKVLLSMVGSIDIGTVESYVHAFFANRVSPSFKGLFNTLYKEEYGEDLLLPSIVYLILEVSCIHYVMFSDTPNKEIGTKLSFVVKNFAVERKGNWNGLLCPELVLQMYQFNETHRCKPIRSQSFDKLINAVVPNNNWTETGLDITSPVVYEQLRSLCIAGSRGKLSSYVSCEEFRGLDSPFAQVYMLVVRMVRDWHWKYVDNSPVYMIREILGDAAKKRKILKNIAEDVRAHVLLKDVVNPQMQSSVLLKRIADGNAINIDGIVFSALEFGVYLFYEMLLETFNA